MQGPNRLPFRTLKCPTCGYSLEGLREAVCPECGERFNSDWLSSVDYEHSIRRTPRRLAIAWGAAAAVLIALITLAVRVDAAHTCTVFALLDIAGIILARRILLG